MAKVQAETAKTRWIIAALAIVFSMGLLAWLGFEFWPVEAHESTNVDAAKQEPYNRTVKPTVSTRFIRTELIDLKVEEFNITELVSDFAVGKGAIERVNNKLIVAEGSGRFIELERQAAGHITGRVLTPQVETNASAMREYFVSRGPSASYFLVRVTDLLFLKDSLDLAVAHSLWHRDGNCVTTNVSVISLDDLLHRAERKMAPWKPLFQSQPCVTLGWPDANVMGGRLAQLDDGRILLSVGNAWLDQPDNPALKNGDYGRIVRIDPADGTYQSFSSGHRNSQGLAIDSANRIWETEHGPKGGDELNILKPGADYGWPHVTYGTDYGSRDWQFSNRQGHHDRYEKPVFAWLPSIAISNLVELNGFNDRWDGDLLITSLRAQSLHRMRLEGERVVYEERIHMHQRIRDIIRLEDGTLVLWTDNGHVLWVSSVDPDRTIEDRIAELPADLQAAIGRCSKCHGFDAQSADRGKVSLFNVHGSKPARGPDHLYSKEMKRFAVDNERWDQNLLDRFIASPEKVVSGTSMAGQGVSDARLRKSVISFLRTLH